MYTILDDFPMHTLTKYTNIFQHIRMSNCHSKTEDLHNM